MSKALKKLEIAVADNGYIVKVLDHGECGLKEPYDKDYLVFISTNDLIIYLKGFLPR